MYKKAGTIVGIVVIILAGVIFWVVDGMDDKETKPVVVNTPSQPRAVKTEPVKPVVVEKEIASVEPATKETVVVEKQVIVEKPPEKIELTRVEPDEGIKVFTELEESDLGDPVANRTEIMVVSKKKIIVLDNNQATKTGKQLVFSVDLLYGDTTMAFLMNGVAYKGISVGDKLKVDYSVYKNDAGVSFPVIMSVLKTD